MADRKKAPAHVALLRGINVGGKNKLPMKDLAKLFAEVGCEDVRTYIQSGNVVFHADATTAEKVPAAVAKAIQEEFSLRVPVVTRSAAELRAVREHNPYVAKDGTDKSDPPALHVMFLADEPSSERAGKLDPKRSPGDEFTLRGREIYLKCPNGLARTKLTNDYFDRALGTVSTVRNWNTVLKLLAMAEATDTA
jgi:uncharacterized protein (DUF1697 family)